MYRTSAHLTWLLLVTTSCSLATQPPAPTKASHRQAPVATNMSHPFLKSIFQKYGHNMLMTFEGFEHLLENLQLGHLVIDDHEVTEHQDGTVFKDFHPHHKHGPCRGGHNCSGSSSGTEMPGQETGTTESNAQHGHIHKDGHDHSQHKRAAQVTMDSQSQARVRNLRAVDNAPIKKCLTAGQIMLYYGIPSGNQITPTTFREICPALVSQLDYKSCYQPNHGYHVTMDAGGSQEMEGNNETSSHSEMMASWDFFSIPARVWGFASVSVLVISMAGLVGVAAVPLMRRVFYTQVLHFLVALAVGSLIGDAALHLIPHALQSADTHSHDIRAHDKSAVYKGLMILGGIYLFFIAEQLMSIVTACKKRKQGHHGKSKQKREEYTWDVGTKLSQYDKQASCEDLMLNPRISDSCGRKVADNIQEEHMMQTEETEAKGHGHGHSHGDGKIPQSIASVAWMVIMGDGLHNFCDGLAIGAAFAASIMGGVSTSVAVFCHELPHELGDFAMLLKAGMSVRQALVYNLLSSFLCFLGMVIGIALGNVNSASAWIFCLVGGMFIYIALVDMLPEITSAESRGSSNACCNLAIQCGGIGLGSTIMLLIALYEDQLKAILGS